MGFICGFFYGFYLKPFASIFQGQKVASNPSVSDS